MVETFKFLNGKYKTASSTFFELPHREGLRGHSHKIFKKDAKTEVAKQFFGNRVVNEWNCLKISFLHQVFQLSKICWGLFHPEQGVYLPSNQVSKVSKYINILAFINGTPFLITLKVYSKSSFSKQLRLNLQIFLAIKVKSSQQLIHQG